MKTSTGKKPVTVNTKISDMWTSTLNAATGKMIHTAFRTRFLRKLL